MRWRTNDSGSLPFAMLVSMVIILTGSMLGTTLAWQARSADREQAIQDARWAADSAVSIAMDRMSSATRLLRGMPVKNRAPANLANDPVSPWRTTAAGNSQMRWFVIPGKTSNSVMLIAEGRTMDQVPLVYTTVIDMTFNFGSGRWTATRVSSDFKEDAAGNEDIRTVPSAPSGLTATPRSQSVSLSWTAPSDGGAAIGDYTIQYRTLPDGSWTVFNDPTTALTSAVVRGLANGTTYEFRVSASNSLGTGPASSPVSATPSP